MKAVILARVSTEDQADKGNSLPAQVERLKRYCLNKHFDVPKIFSFDESAYKTKRDEFDKILDYLNKQEEKIAVCFDKVDRFSRNVFDKRVATLYEMTMKDEIELHFASDNLVITPNISATEKFHFGVNLGLAKYYSDAISDSVKRAYEIKIKRGEWIGRPPIGFKSVYANDEDRERRKRTNIIPDPKTAPLIKRMFELYANGTSVKLLADKMGKMGLNGTKSKKGITPNVVYSCLTNPFYYGVMKINGVLTPHKYQPIISKQLFLKCRQMMDSYHKKPFAYGSKPFALKGLIKCADPACGCTITAEGHEGDHVYYSCTNYKNVHLKRIYVRSEDLLTPIKKVIAKLYMPDYMIEKTIAKLRELNESKNKFYENSISALRNDYDDIERKINRLFDLLTDGTINKDMFAKKIKEFKDQQYELEEKMKQFTIADEDFYLNANMLLHLVKKVAEIFENSEPDVKRQILNFLVQNAELDGKNLNFTLKKPFDGLLQAKRCYSQRGRRDLNP